MDIVNYRRFNYIVIEVGAWMSNYISSFYIDVIWYQYLITLKDQLVSVHMSGHSRHMAMLPFLVNGQIQKTMRQQQ